MAGRQGVNWASNPLCSDSEDEAEDPVPTRAQRPRLPLPSETPAKTPLSDWKDSAQAQDGFNRQGHRVALPPNEFQEQAPPPTGRRRSNSNPERAKIVARAAAEFGYGDVPSREAAHTAPVAQPAVVPTLVVPTLVAPVGGMPRIVAPPAPVNARDGRASSRRGETPASIMPQTRRAASLSPKNPRRASDADAHKEIRLDYRMDGPSGAPLPAPRQLNEGHLGQAWFHGRLRRVDAERLLTKHGLVDGLFLLRNTSLGVATFAVSLCYGGKVYHNTVETAPDGKYLYVASGRSFDSLIDLVNHYSTASRAPHLTLRMFCPRGH